MDHVSTVRSVKEHEKLCVGFLRPIVPGLCIWKHVACDCLGGGTYSWGGFKTSSGGLDQREIRPWVTGAANRSGRLLADTTWLHRTRFKSKLNWIPCTESQLVWRFLFVLFCHEQSVLLRSNSNRITEAVTRWGIPCTKWRWPESAFSSPLTCGYDSQKSRGTSFI